MQNAKGRLLSGPFNSIDVLSSNLQCGLDLKAPGFQKRLRNVLRILIPACPLSQTSRPQILVGGELVFPHNLLEFSNRWGDGANGLRFTPVWISASLCHEPLPFHSGEYELQNF